MIMCKMVLAYYNYQKRPIFCTNSKIQAKNENCSISCVRTQYGRTTLSPQRFANHLIYLQLRTRRGKEKRPPEPIPATFVLSGSAGRSERPIRNVAGFSRFLSFVKELMHSAFYIVCTIFSLSTQLCLSCDRHFMTHLLAKNDR